MTEKQKAYYERMRATGGFAALGRKGGAANVAKHGKEHMEDIGRRGGIGLRNKFKTEAEAKAYYSRIGSTKKGEGTPS